MEFLFNFFDWLLVLAFFVASPPTLADIDKFDWSVEEVVEINSRWTNDYWEIASSLTCWRASLGDPALSPIHELEQKVAYLKWGARCWNNLYVASASDIYPERSKFMAMQWLWFELGPVEYTARRMPEPLPRNKAGVIIFPWETSDK